MILLPADRPPNEALTIIGDDTDTVAPPLPPNAVLMLNGSESEALAEADPPAAILRKADCESARTDPADPPKLILIVTAVGATLANARTNVPQGPVADRVALVAVVAPGVSNAISAFPAAIGAVVEAESPRKAVYPDGAV